MARPDLRRNDEIRKIKITPNYIAHAEGSCLIDIGDTKVICTATIEEGVPPHLKGKGTGWVTAEYSMLPRATLTRNRRDISKLKLSPRSAEIQRFIGRSLRSVVDLRILGENSIIIDCDVIQADGGTRCASVTGGFIALYLCFKKLLDAGLIKKIPIRAYVAAISTGVFEDDVILDLNFYEDSKAIADCNAVMTSDLDIIEFQACGEERPFTKAEFDKMMSLSKKGINKLIREQRKIIGDFI